MNIFMLVTNYGTFAVISIVRALTLLRRKGNICYKQEEMSKAC